MKNKREFCEYVVLVLYNFKRWFTSSSFKIKEIQFIINIFFNY